MKKNISLILTMLLLYSSATGQSLTPLLEIKTADLDSKEFLDLGKNKFIKYLKEEVEVNKMFKLKVLASSANETVNIEKSPTSSVHKANIISNQSPFLEKEIEITLKENEDVDYEVTVISKSDSKTYTFMISLSTDKNFRPNSNFIFLSAIRSVAGKPQTNEFFDLNLKFNYLSKFFTLFGLDLSLAPADSGQLRITEGLVTVNYFVNKGDTLKSGNLNRAFFLGVGSKIFNQQPYFGGHVGSIEINGPLFSSYLLIGYYFNAYGRSVKIANIDQPLDYKNNIYSEFTLAFDNKKNVAGILSDIRIKLGMLFPFTNSDTDIVKPMVKDIQYRLVLEVPIGGIYKF